MKNTLLKISMFIGMFGLLSLAVGWTPQKAAFPNISGSWHSDGNGITLKIIQSGGHISSTFSSSGYDHVLAGEWRNGEFRYKVVRTSIADGCTTVMYGAFVNFSPTQMTSIISGTDGKCDLDVNFHEELIWQKVQIDQSI